VEALPGVERFVCVLSPAEAGRRLQDEPGPNLLLLDIDYGVHDADFLLLLTQRPHTKLLLLTHDDSHAAPYRRRGLTGILPKPAEDPSAFVEAVAEAVRGLSGLTGQLARPSTKPSGRPGRARERLIAVASSTGGTDALEKLLTKLPADLPPIVIVQHMPPVFTRLFAERLDGLCALTVTEGQNHEVIRSGTAYIAPGGFHMRLIEQKGFLALETFTGEKIHGVIPAADVLFQSAAALRNPNIIGVILTGMGADGAEGLLAMRRAGAATIGQSERTCVVYGMPKVAMDLGAVQFQLDLEDIAAKLVQLAGAPI